MEFALNEHPEWAGDWATPAGVEAVEINPKTGELTVATDTEKRTEYFINETGPNHVAPAAEEQASPEEQPEASPPPNLPQEEPPTLCRPRLHQRRHDLMAVGRHCPRHRSTTGLIAVECAQ